MRAEDLVRLFCAAFDRRDTTELEALLAPGVTADVLDSGFGTESGPADVMAKSIAHLLEDRDGTRLRAEPFALEDETWIVFVGGDPETVECAARAEVGDGGIRRLEYLVPHFRGDDLARIGVAWSAA